MDFLGPYFVHSLDIFGGCFYNIVIMKKILSHGRTRMGTD